MTSSRASGVLEPVASQGERTGYDPDTPQALTRFMLRDWEAPKDASPNAVDGLAYYADRRRRLSEAFAGEAIVIPTGSEKVRANDTYYRFRPGSDFYYLTGNMEPDCVLVMEPLAGCGHREVLYVEPSTGKTHERFFTDRKKGELWVGPRLGVEGSRARYGVDAAGLPELPDRLDAIVRGAAPWRVLRGFDETVDARLGPPTERDAGLATALAEMRLVKDELEVRALDEAVAMTARAFDDVMRALPALAKEREVETTFYVRARVDGNDVGYGTVAAAGPHACTLHWTRNDGPLRRGDLLLLDAGVEGPSLYTADVTRTVPIGGRFSAAQREIYALVLEAQAAAFAQCRPGNDFLDPNRAAMRVLADGLERLGILPVAADDALREEHQFYRRYSLHNVSHMLGLDVHDCAAARQENYKYGKLVPGIVLTIEPGLYLQPDDLTVPERYRGIGVRIEDDVLITRDGHRVLSAAIPREVSDVERWASG